MHQFKAWTPIIIIAIFFISLIVFRKDMIKYISESRSSQVPATEKQTIENLIRTQYNYIENGESFEYTFLEFGSKGCSACKQMESVMQEIKDLYPTRVKVVFINVSEKENQELSQYFGIAMIPTQVLLDKNGREFFRHTGFYSTEDILDVMKLN